MKPADEDTSSNCSINSHETNPKSLGLSQNFPCAQESGLLNSLIVDTKNQEDFAETKYHIRD